MGFNLHFKVMGQVQLSRTFDELSLGVANLRKPFEKIKRDFYQTQKATFDAEGAYEGKSKWKQLDPAYKRWKEREYPSSGILVLDGTLKKAATSPNAKGSVSEVTNSSVALGVDIPINGWNLAALHQFGTKNMPAREVIRLTSPQKKRWVRIMRDHFESIIRRRR